MEFILCPLHVYLWKTEGTKKNVMTEADLLAALVQRIDFATAAVPRGAHRLHGTKIIPATEFQGEAFRVDQLNVMH